MYSIASVRRQALRDWSYEVIKLGRRDYNTSQQQQQQVMRRWAWWRSRARGARRSIVVEHMRSDELRQSESPSHAVCLIAFQRTGLRPARYSCRLLTALGSQTALTTVRNHYSKNVTFVYWLSLRWQATVVYSPYHSHSCHISHNRRSVIFIRLLRWMQRSERSLKVNFIINN